MTWHMSTGNIILFSDVIRHASGAGRSRWVGMVTTLFPGLDLLTQHPAIQCSKLIAGTSGKNKVTRPDFQHHPIPNLTASVEMSRPTHDTPAAAVQGPVCSQTAWIQSPQRELAPAWRPSCQISADNKQTFSTISHQQCVHTPSASPNWLHLQVPSCRQRKRMQMCHIRCWRGPCWADLHLQTKRRYYCAQCHCLQSNHCWRMTASSVRTLSVLVMTAHHDQAVHPALAPHANWNKLWQVRIVGHDNTMMMSLHVMVHKWNISTWYYIKNKPEIRVVFLNWFLASFGQWDVHVHMIMGSTTSVEQSIPGTASTGTYATIAHKTDQ